MQSLEQKILPQSEYYPYQPSALAEELFFYPVVSGHFYYEPGYHLQRNRFDSFLLLFVINGSCSGSTGDGSFFSAHKNQMILLDCYAPHEYGNSSSNQILDVLWIHFDGPLARNFFRQIISLHGNVITPEDPNFMQHQLEQLLLVFQTSQAVREEKVSERITKILTALLTTSAGSESSADLSPVQTVEDSLAFINEHFRENISLKNLSDHVHLSPYYFSRIFQKRTGYTPHQYIIATRINSAKYLLQTSELSVKEICYSCGFRSESNFCASFRRAEGVTPGEYRRNAADFCI